MAERVQRLVFGEVAEVYDRARPSYPPALVDEVLAFAAMEDGDAVEVGSGTGKATMLFAARGIGIVCVEPDARMAEVARRNCAAFPGVSIEVAPFETWEGTGPFDLLYSAQAWHWLDADVRCAKAHALLRPGGAIALFWNRQRWPDEDLRRSLEAIYERLAPELLTRAIFPAVRRMDPSQPAAEELRSSGLFTDVATHDFEWSATCTTTRYLELLSTQSDHRLLDEARRAELFETLEAVIDGAGGAIELHATTDLHLGRARPVA